MPECGVRRSGQFLLDSDPASMRRGDNMKRTPTSTISPTTPIRSMRAYCLDCTGGNKAVVRECSFTDCPLYSYRMGKRPPKGVAATPMKTIRANCLECCSGSFAEVRRCPASECATYRYRLGRKVELGGDLSPANALLDALTMNDAPKQPKRQKQALFEEF